MPKKGLTALGNKGSIASAIRAASGRRLGTAFDPDRRDGHCGLHRGQDWRCVGVGTQGVIMKRTVSDWVSETSLTAQPFTGIGCASPDDIFVVGPGGLILHKY